MDYRTRMRLAFGAILLFFLALSGLILRLYIAKCRARKLTEREIKNLLLSSGWDVELIEQGMLREEDSR